VVKATEPQDLARAVERATARYAASMRPSGTARRVDGDVKDQADRYHETFIHATMRRLQVRRVLDRCDVLPYLSMHYMNFAERIDKLVRTVGDESLRRQVGFALERWQCLGCDPRVLAEILSEVFSLGAGLSPGRPEAGTVPAPKSETRNSNDDSSSNAEVV
jgi:hypothetical protein